MSHVLVEQAAEGRHRAPPPTSSGAQQVLRGLGVTEAKCSLELRGLAWEHAGSRAGAEHYLRNRWGGGLHRDSCFPV